MDCGHKIFGENQVQEALNKWPLLKKKYQVLGIDNLNNYYDVKLKKNRLGILLKNICASSTLISKTS